jgi:hypothetical protein
MATVLKRIVPQNAVKKLEAGTVHWFNECVERGKMEIFTQIMTVTPGLAAELLRRNPDNRNIKPAKVQHFARDMISERWAFNGETVIVGKDGDLNDGQHRLTALIEANKSLPFLFVFGVDRDTRTTLDQGSARTAGDYLAMDGHRYTNVSPTAARYIMAYERSDGRNISQRALFSNAEVTERVRGDPQITASAAYAMHHYKSYKHFVGVSVIAACHYLLSEIHPTEATAYLDQVCLGENIKRGDPAFAVRAALAADRKYRGDAMEVVFHGWNRHRSGQSMSLARVNGTFPALV